MKYDFKCTKCNHTFEKDLTLKDILNSSKSLKTTCPKCGKSARKLINKPAVFFKGAGFYVNDKESK
jgi:putative FmdB family regulatory protein